MTQRPPAGCGQASILGEAVDEEALQAGLAPMAARRLLRVQLEAGGVLGAGMSGIERSSFT
jgi:hypothetical protein